MSDVGVLGEFHPGLIVLMGSGETTAAGGQAFEATAKRLGDGLEISVLETPAGFELNAERVAGRVSDYLRQRLQNYHPVIHQVAARKKGTPESPDNAEIMGPLLTSRMIFFGPGSPTYTVRQMQGSLAWSLIQARQRQGAALVLASAATLSISSRCLPVYEIYKVGEDIHWKPGLDLLAPYGMQMVFVPHWNNQEGGAELDTSRCFMGIERFTQLVKMLPAETTVVGIDEGTSLIIDLERGECEVYGRGEAHCLCGDSQQDFPKHTRFLLREFGHFHIPDLREGIDPEAWEKIRQAGETRHAEAAGASKPPEPVIRLAEERQAARERRDWLAADRLRVEISAAGWKVVDTAQGSQLEPL